MKKALFLLLIMLFGTAAFADRIILTNGAMLKGKIIRVTGHDVEFDPEGPRAFDIVDKSAVVRIVYDDGKVVIYRQDILHLTDGTSMRGVIAKVTGEDVIIMAEGVDEQKTVPRNRVSRIEYADGRVVHMAKKETGPVEEPAEEGKQAPGFSGSRVRIAGFFSFSGPWGGILARERRLFSIYRPDLIRAYFFPKEYHLDIMSMGGGGEIDALLPAIRFRQMRAFDFTAVKFGVRARYGFQFSDSMIVKERVYYSTVEGYEQFRGRLMSHHHWAAGPVMNLVFSPRSNLFNFLINFYALTGQIFKGQIKAAAALRSAGQLQFELAGLYGFPAFITALAPGIIAATQYNNRATYSGYTVRLGLGPHFTMNGYFPITFGFNVTYAYSYITFSKAPMAYLTGNRKCALHEIGAEISSGIHI